MLSASCLLLLGAATMNGQIGSMDSLYQVWVSKCQMCGDALCIAQKKKREKKKNTTPFGHEKSSG